MSDENNNEQNQNKQDPENKYSVNSENKYETHGIEEDINDSFTDQDFADDNKKDEILKKKMIYPTQKMKSITKTSIIKIR